MTMQHQAKAPAPSLSSSCSLAWATNTTCTYSQRPGASTNTVDVTQPSRVANTVATAQTGLTLQPFGAAAQQNPPASSGTHHQQAPQRGNTGLFQVKDSLYYQARGGHMHVEVEGYGQGILKSIDSRTGMARVQLQYGGVLNVLRTKVKMHAGHDIGSGAFGMGVVDAPPLVEQAQPGFSTPQLGGAAAATSGHEPRSGMSNTTASTADPDGDDSMDMGPGPASAAGELDHRLGFAAAGSGAPASIRSQRKGPASIRSIRQQQQAGAGGLGMKRDRPDTAPDENDPMAFHAHFSTRNRM